MVALSQASLTLDYKVFSQIVWPGFEDVDIDVVTKEPSLPAKKYDVQNT